MIDDPVYLSIVHSPLLAVAKYFVIVLSIAAVGFIYYLVKNTSWLSFRYLRDLEDTSRFQNYNLHKVSREWMKIIGRLEKGLESEYKLAVIEADSLLNSIYGRLGYGGDSLGDKLKALNKDTCPNLELVAEAHKVRNGIVHDPDYHLALEEARKVIGIYEETMRFLRMI